MAALFARKSSASADDVPGPGLLSPESVRPIRPPAALPDAAWTGFDADGRPVSASLAAMRGHPFLLNVWARWCDPCLREMPTLDRLAATLAPRGIDIVALCFERTDAAGIADFFATHGIAGLRPAIDPNGAACRALGIHALPVTLLIDRDGRLVARADGAIDWGRARDRVLALLAAA